MTQEELIDLERKHGASNYAPLPVVLAKGKGACLWDTDGNRYLDFLSGIGAVSQGHGHPRILSALAEQAAQLTHVSRVFYSSTFGDFARFATEYFGYERILVMNTGVEAIETALKLCRKWGYTRKGIPEGQAKVIVCENNFHGRTLTAVSASTGADKKPFAPFMPGFVPIPYNDLPALEAALKDKTVAGFLVEPIQGEGGVVVPADGYLKAAAELCRSAEVLLIADEVQTGIARTGRRLACDHEGVRPDIVCLGKALGGGVLPVSAVLANDAVMGVFQPGDHGSTFGGNALACAVAKVALQVVADEQLAENAERQGARFRDEVRSWQHPWIAEVRGKGLLNAVVFKADCPVKAGDLCLALKAYGVLTKNTRDHIIRFAPPLVITDAEMGEGIAALKRALG